MRLLTVTLMALATFGLVACASSVPKCSDKEITDLVVEIANEEMVRQVGSDTAKVFSYVVQAIRTTNTNDKTGSHECAANLQITGPDGSNSIPITYTVENTDDGEEFYVNVSGL